MRCLPAASLRYFTVYGPRQRPDMGFHRFIDATLDGRAIEMYGDGLQTRDFTFIDDIVDANIRAAAEGVVGVFNIGGGSRVSLRDVFAALQEVAGELRIEQRPREPGDVQDTWADTSAAAGALGYAPRTLRRDGLAAQVAWQRERRRSRGR